MAKVSLMGIRLTEDGTFISNTKILCEQCANPYCENYAAKYCRDFTPTIPFIKNAKGLTGRFNTFRLGDAWSRRLREGMIVAMSVGDERVGFAKVERVICGDKVEMANQFGKDNHSIKHCGIVENFGEAMLKKIKNTCGTRSFNQYANATVIYLNAIEQ